MKKILFVGAFALIAIIATTIYVGGVSANSGYGAEHRDKNKSVASAMAGPLLVEDFSYSVGALLTENGWTAHSAGGTNPIATTSPGLTLAGYPGSGIGNAVSMTVSGEDDNRTFAVQSAGTVYAAFLVNASDAAVDSIGGYFFHFGPDPVGTNFRGRIFIKKDASNNIAFGLSKAATADPNVAFTPFSYSLNTTYLVILKYSIVDGATNDTVDLFVSTTTPGTEPSATLSAIDVSATDINPGTVSLRQGTASTSPTVRVDGVRVGTSWAGVTQPIQHVVDYDGDGRTDYSVLRFPSVAPPGVAQITYWNKNSSGGVQIVDWGDANTDYPTPGDYDGDGKTDIAVYRAGATVGAQSTFYILRSSDSTFSFVSFGLNGDQVVARDFDGDGKTDPAIFRAGANPGDQATWWIRKSTTDTDLVIPFGTTGDGSNTLDTPVPGDYDGDGKFDLAVYRVGISPTNTFIYLRSSDGQVVYQPWGNFQTDYILPGDYDGDGKTDFCAGRTGATSSSPMTWYILQSSNSQVIVQPFGVSSDLPVQGDYDGDGKTDIAVYRGSSSTFWVFGSSNSSVSATAWGLTGDYPVGTFDAR